MSCIVYIQWVTTLATCLISFIMYKNNELQMFNAIQKLSCKANCKTPFFLIMFVVIHGLSCLLGFSIISYCDLRKGWGEVRSFGNHFSWVLIEGAVIGKFIWEYEVVGREKRMRKKKRSSKHKTTRGETRMTLGKNG